MVKAYFRGAHKSKLRPLVVVSTNVYHSTRPDVIVAVLTSNLSRCTGPTAYIVQDWAAAGFHQRSAFRVYLETVLAADLTKIGRLSDRDWAEARARLRLGLAVS